MAELEKAKPSYPVRKATLLKVIEETTDAASGSRLILTTAIAGQWRHEELIGSLELGLFLGPLLRAMDPKDAGLIHMRIRNRDILPIVGKDAA